VVAAIELTVPDLGRELQPVMASLTIAARSLSRELSGGGGGNARSVVGVYGMVQGDPGPAVQSAG
jgi:hypothetical protein